MAEVKPISLTSEELLRLFDYAPDSGELYWRDKHKGMNPGDLAGGITANGYWRIHIGHRTYKRSKLIWIIETGNDPYPKQIDHINRDRADDRFVNLRLATQSENNSNRAWGASSYRYIYFEPACWRVRVVENGVRKSLGRYATENEAVERLQQWEDECQS